jgi:predicted dehydrogenase
MTHLKTSRRDFLKTSAAVAAPLVLPASVALAKKDSPSETAILGLIGCGGRSRKVTEAASEAGGCKTVAVCDCFEPAARAASKNGARKVYTDFRKMIEQEKLDGVMVETTTHARAWVVIQALAMGVDAYIEKPMCLTVDEGRAMVDAAKKFKRVATVGTQQRSIPLNNWACDLIQQGAIGKVKVVLAPNFIAPEAWEKHPGQPMPAGGSDNWWDIWTNQAPMRPYHSQLYNRWNRYAAYDGGGISFGVTGWGTHSYDQIQRGLGTNTTCPTTIMLEEPGRVQETGLRNRAVRVARAKVRMWYDDGTELRLHLDRNRGPGLGCIFVGEKGKIEVNRDKITANPTEILERPDRPKTLKEQGLGESTPHLANWIECMKSRKTPTADVEFGHHSTTLCNLVNIVREVGQVGKKLHYDPKKEQFTNCDEANQNRWMTRERRKGYEIPVV